MREPNQGKDAAMSPRHAGKTGGHWSGGGEDPRVPVAAGPAGMERAPVGNEKTRARPPPPSPPGDFVAAPMCPPPPPHPRCRSRTRAPPAERASR